MRATITPTLTTTFTTDTTAASRYASHLHAPLVPETSSGSFNNVASYNHVFDLYEGVTDDGGAIYFATGGTAFIAAGNQMSE